MKRLKFFSLIVFGMFLLVFISSLIINISIQDNVINIIKEVSLGVTVTASFSFSLSISIEIKNYYADKIYENCNFGDVDNHDFNLRKKCNQICCLITEYIENFKKQSSTSKSSLCYKYFSQISSIYKDLQSSLDSLSDKTSLQKEKQFIDELNLLKPMLIKNMNEISSTMLANYSSITEFNDKLNRIQKNYKEY